MSSAQSPTGGDAASTGGVYPDITSPTDSVIAGDFGAMSAEEQEAQRTEWKDELKKTEEEILTLKQVLASKEAHAAGLKRRLGITAWREMTEDMAESLKNIQDSAAYKKTAETAAAARDKTTTMWNSVTSSTSFQTASGRVGSMFGAVKAKMPASMSTQGLSGVLGGQKAQDGVEPAKEATNGDDSKTTAAEANGGGEKKAEA